MEWSLITIPCLFLNNSGYVLKIYGNPVENKYQRHQRWLTFRRTLDMKKPTPRFHNQQGFTLVESLIAISLLGLFSIGTLTAIPIIQYKSATTSLRSSAIMSMESGMEVLRSTGFTDLEANLAWNGIADNGLNDVWEYDPVVGGELAPMVTLRRGFAKGEETGGHEPDNWVEVTEQAVIANQTCSVVAAGTALGRSEQFLRVTLNCQWNFRGRVFQESLYTIIEH